MKILRKLTAALSAFCLSAVIHAGPALAQTIPFYAEGFGTYNPADGTYAAPGVGTLLGRYDNFGGVQVTPTDDPFVFNFESSGTNLGISGGDVLETAFQDGTLTVTPVEGEEGLFTAVWEADVVVIGGAGVYADVESHRKPLKIVAVNEPFSFSDTEWKFGWTLTGKVDLGGPKKVVSRPLKIKGAGVVSELPSVDTPWGVQGNASGLGRYTSPPMDSAEANLVSVDFDPRFSPLEGRVPFSGTSTFIAADGSELSLDFEGFISILPNGELRWVADFIPAVEMCTGRFSEVESGSVVMLATSPPLGLGEIPFSWFGGGHLVISK